MISIQIDDVTPDFFAAIVQAKGVKIEFASPQLQVYCNQVVANVIQNGTMGGDDRRKAIRDLLRTGGYKPAGRGRPAQEYLQMAVERDQHLPSILNVVDLINLVSLSSGFPISLISLDRVHPPFQIRYGLPEEEYVFNPSGQSLNLGGLLCIASTPISDGKSTPTDKIAVASPVKDSMLAKVQEGDTQIAAIIYGSKQAAEPNEIKHWGHELGHHFASWCDAEEVEQTFLTATT